jgi:uncharacterized protein with HEPN domain
MSPRDWPNRIEDILDAIAETESFVQGLNYEQLCGDPKTLKAVMANLVVIGEAAAHVPEEVSAAHPEVPWSDMKAMRNHVVHVYFSIDPQVIWDTVKQDLPALVAPLKALLSKSP